MDALTILVAVVALAVGYLIGKGSWKQSDDTPTFSDPDFAAVAAEKGREAVHAHKEKRKARILEKARAAGRITNDDVEDIFCISDSTARNYLNELEAEGKLTQVGAAGRSAHFEPR